MLQVALILIVPILAEALFFPAITLTNAAGATIVATTSAQTAALAGAGLLAFAKGAALGSLMRGSGIGRKARSISQYSRPSYNTRSKRSLEEELIAYLNQAYKTMNGKDTDQCFSQLICELNTKDGMNYKSKPILNTLQVAEMVGDKLIPAVDEFYTALNLAGDRGKEAGDIKMCRSFFPCKLTGVKLDELISKQYQLTEEVKQAEAEAESEVVAESDTK